jgi:glucose-6-phosphate dehydrogenase assembly protein OpcA
VSTILWDTNGSEIVRALAAERRAAGALASGLALTLVVVSDEQDVTEAQDAATAAAAAHPCRVLVVVRRKLDADDRLDAEVQVGGKLGSNESVVMRMYGRLTLHAESVVLPLLASDAPVVTWWHGTTPPVLAHDALGVLAGRRITDTATAEKPLAALKARAKDYAPGDTDLAWTRTTPWRALLASAFDDLAGTPNAAEVQAEVGNPSAALLAGWLQARLGVRVRQSSSAGPGITSVEVRLEEGAMVRVDRPDGYLATLTRTGMTDRQLPLKRRSLSDLIGEELRRLDADQPYADALSAVTGEKDLDSRPAMRQHVWVDPMGASAGRRKTPKRPPAKQPGRKTPTRETAAQKTTARKTAAKRAAAKKTAANVAAARKPAAKKTPATKTAATKTAATKTAATKTAATKTAATKTAAKKAARPGSSRRSP